MDKTNRWLNPNPHDQLRFSHMTGSISSRQAVQRALNAVSPDCGAAVINGLVTLLDTAMTSPGRRYHNLTHALMVADSDDPLDIIAGLFHDIVQTRADAGIPANVFRPLAGFIEQKPSGDFEIRASDSTRSSPILRIVMRCFGLPESTSILPRGLENEFLSALVATESLRNILNFEQLAAISIAIEATVPFRKNHDQLNAGYFSALTSIGDEYRLVIPRERQHAHIQRAVRVSNRDVKGFCQPDPFEFFDDTWSLIQESSNYLRSENLTSIKNYRKSLESMVNFFSSLNAVSIFKVFEGEPSQDEHQKQICSTTNNLYIYLEVMHAKLLAIYLIETQFKDVDRPIKLARGLPKPSQTESSENWAAIRILEAGSTASLEFDIYQSPVSYRLLKELGAVKIRDFCRSIRLESQQPIDIFHALPEEIQRVVLSTSLAMDF